MTFKDAESIKLRNAQGFIDSANPLNVKIGDGDNTTIVNAEGQLHVVLMGKVDDGNSKYTHLDADEVFTGTAFNTLDYGFIFVTVFSDVSSATDGLDVQVSSDGSTNWRTAEKYTITGGIEKTYAFQPNKNFFRVVYTNGGTDQSTFDLQTVLKKTSSLPSSHRISDSVTGQDDAQLIKSVITYQSTGTDIFKNIGVQVPLPTDGDSLYEKDINIEKSDNGGFSGEIIDYFNSLNSVNNDASATNPKVIKVWLKRTAFASSLGLGCDDLSKTFSNIKLELFGSGEVVRNTIDESGDNTKRNSYLFEFAPTAFNGFILSFHTADEVGLSNITMPKEVQVVSRLKAVKPDGVVTDIDATMGGNLKVSLEEFDPTFIINPLPVRDPLLGIARGLVTGMTHVNKFGRAPFGIQTTNTDIWDRADATPTQQEWIAPTQSRIHAIVSTSNNDSDTGGTNPQSDGTRIVTVSGLIDWDTSEVSEDIIMDGTNSVNTINSYVIIHRMEVLTKGGNASGPNVGIITATAATDGTVTAQINATQGQTQMAIYGIPSTQKAYMTNYYISLHEAGATPSTTLSVDVNLLVNPEPDVELTNFLIKHTQGVSNVSTSYLPHNFKPYLEIQGPAIIKMHSTSTDADTDASSGFDLILVDN